MERELRDYRVTWLAGYGDVRFSAPVEFRGIRSAVCWGFWRGVFLFFLFPSLEVPMMGLGWGLGLGSDVIAMVKLLFMYS